MPASYIRQVRRGDERFRYCPRIFGWSNRVTKTGSKSPPKVAAKTASKTVRTQSLRFGAFARAICHGSRSLKSDIQSTYKSSKVPFDSSI
jgi:hypothetical protein